jgi:hypothetical protein
LGETFALMLVDWTMGFHVLLSISMVLRSAWARVPLILLVEICFAFGDAGVIPIFCV